MEISSSKRFIARALLYLLLAVAVVNQLQFVVLPFSREAALLPRLLALDEARQVRAFLKPLSRALTLMQQYPPQTRFYFAPVFEDSGDTKIWWWYVQILLRYFAYPRAVFCLDREQYHNSKDVFRRKFVGTAARYAELPWLRERGVTQIILFRNNALSIVPAETEIGPTL